MVNDFEVYRIDFDTPIGIYIDEMNAIAFILSDMPSDDFWYCVVNSDGDYTAVVHQGQVWRPTTKNRAPLFPTGAAAVQWLRQHIYGKRGEL